MIIEVISSNTIKIILNKMDMANYDISFEKLDRSSPETKKLLIDLIQNIQDEKSIDISSEHLFIEAFPKDDGGCLLYLSMLNDKLKSNTQKNCLYNSIVCKIESPTDLIKISNQLFNIFNHILHNSELYYLDGTYLLILHTFKKADKKLKTFLNEYCKIVGSGETNSSLIREYNNCIFPINAIEEIIKKSI